MIRAKPIAFFCLLILLFTERTNTQEDPWQTLHFGVVESVRTLLHPATQVEFLPGEIQFRASKTRYTFLPATGRWEVQATSERDGYLAGWGMVEGVNEIVTPSGKLTISRVGPGELTLNWLACPQAIGPLRLWTTGDLGRVWLKDMQRRLRPRPKTAADLAKWMTVADPQVMAWDEDKRDLWLGIGFYAGEGSGL